MKISIVTPSFNQGRFIKEAIESVLSQNYKKVEHIIVDNCSADETPKILARYPHLKVTRAKDRGQSDALNKGFKVAGGDIVGWLNADDKYLQGSFQRVIQAFTDHPELDIVYGDYRFVDVNGKLMQVRKEIGFDTFMLKYLHVLYIPTTATFFRRKIFDDGNYLDINYHYAMDYDFFVRLAGRGYKFGHISHLMADFRRHAGAKSQHIIKGKAEMEDSLLTHDKFLQNLDFPIRIPIRNTLMFFARLKRCVLKLISGAYFV